MGDIFNFKEAKYNLRKFNDMAVGNIKTTTYRTETIRYQAPLTWEMVPEHIKHSQSLSEFKTKIKSWIPEGCKCNLCKTYLNGVGIISFLFIRFY